MGGDWILVVELRLDGLGQLFAQFNSDVRGERSKVNLVMMSRYHLTYPH